MYQPRALAILSLLTVCFWRVLLLIEKQFVFMISSCLHTFLTRVLLLNTTRFRFTLERVACGVHGHARVDELERVRYTVLRLFLDPDTVIAAWAFR